jgi:hypothetical protein
MRCINPQTLLALRAGPSGWEVDAVVVLCVGIHMGTVLRPPADSEQSTRHFFVVCSHHAVFLDVVEEKM